MTPDCAHDYSSIVRSNWKQTTGYLLASRQPCLDIRDDERRSVQGRVLVARDASDLTHWVPSQSWVLAVIVCPGDSLDSLAAWVQRHRVDTSRIWFFLHPTTPLEALRPWSDAGHPTDQVDVVEDWRRLHKLFGAALNDQIYLDWADASGGG